MCQWGLSGKFISVKYRLHRYRKGQGETVCVTEEECPGWELRMPVR